MGFEQLLNILNNEAYLNLWDFSVALGTMLLAIATFSSIYLNRKTLDQSKKQLDILAEDLVIKKNHQKRELILDHINYILKPLKEELRVEIRRLSINKFDKIVTYRYRRHTNVNLKNDFPAILELLNPVFVSKYHKIILEEIIHDFKYLESSLNNRDQLYEDLFTIISKIKDYLKSENIEEKIFYSLNKHDLIKSLQNSKEPKDKVLITMYKYDKGTDKVIISDPLEQYYCHYCQAVEAIKKSIFLDIIDNKGDFNGKFESEITECIAYEYKSIKLEVLNTLDSNEILKLKTDFLELIPKIIRADINIIEDLCTIIEEYRLIFNLNVKEIND